MTNREVARILDDIADILQIKGENPFKIRAYHQAANSIYNLEEDIHYLYQQDLLGNIPGVGTAIKAKIEELIEKGNCEYHEQLLSEFSPGILEILALPGIGHSTVRLIYEKLGIKSLEELWEAAQQRKIRALPGLGAKTEYNIKKGIEMLRQTRERAILGLVQPMGEKLRGYLENCEGVEAVSLVGSVRRGKPLVGDLDLLVASRDEEKVRQKTRNYREVKDIRADTPGHISGRLKYDVAFEVIIVDPEQFYSALFWTTGSKEHREELLGKMDRSLLDNCRNEMEVYKALKLPFIPPELRENRGEIEAARENRLPDLVELPDLKGDLHCHSSWSDGAHSIEEMVEKAMELGYSYLAITDHSKSLPISGGLKEDRLAAQGQVIEDLNRQWEQFSLLKGIEVDILKDGCLDFTSDILNELDVVVASIHSHFKLDEERQSERLCQAIKSGQVDIIGHLTGRLLNRRPPYDVDVERILEAAAKNKVILEINSHPDRLDINEDIVRRAKDYGVKVAINSDAHHRNDLPLVKYGVLTARRGWLEKKDVVNTWDKEELIKFLKE